MKPLTRVLVLALCIIAVRAVQSQTAANSGIPSTSTGKKIGQIIQDAIGVAAPSVEKLINALFPGKSDKVDKSTATTVTNKQVDTATNSAKDSIRAISEVSGELGVVSEFLALSVPASQRVSRILERLDQPVKGTMSAAIKTDWTPLQDNLKKLGDISNTDLKKVQDGGLRLQLTQVRDIYSANLQDIENAVEVGSLQDVKDQLRAVQALLNSIVTTAGIEITNLQMSLDSAVQWANNIKSQSGGEEDPRVRKFETVFDEELTLARKTLRSK